MLTRRNDFVEVMEMMDKRLNDKGKNWRHVFKVRPEDHHVSDRLSLQALTVLDYCLHAGSENVVIYFKDNIYVVKCVRSRLHRSHLD